MINIYKAKVNDSTFEFEFLDNTGLKGNLNGKPFKIDLMDQLWSKNVIYNNNSYSINLVSLDAKNKNAVISINNKEISVFIEDHFDLLLDKFGIDSLSSVIINEVKSPMPGQVLSINVSVGDKVKEGESLLVLEAMKMENIIKSPSDGTIKSIEINATDTVEKNQVLIYFV